MQLRIFDSVERDLEDGYHFLFTPQTASTSANHSQTAACINLVPQQHRAINTHAEGVA